MQDDKIRSVLKDVEVKAPRRVWRNVAAQLDAAAGPVSAGHDWLRWAGAAVAFAAIVAGVFLFNPREVPEDAVQVRNVQVAQSAPVVKEENSEPVVRQSILAEKVSPVVEIKETAETKDIPKDIVVAEVPESPEALEPSETPIGKKNAGSASVRPEPDGSAAIEFEKMAREDERKFSRGIQSLYAQGSIGGNDSDISFYTNRARLSSGTSIKKTGITELGESEYGIPVSFGVGFRIYVIPNLSIGVGLDYSLLSRTFNGLYEDVSSGVVMSSMTGSVHHTMHYLGVPVGIYYDIISAERIKFYAYGGGEMEYCLGNNYTVYSNTGANVHFSSSVDRLQWSVGAGLGVEFRLSDHLGLYLDPSAKYYFHCYQPKSIRTERPLMFNFDTGLRFNF
ncbi:MAG: outer membrane beta-barrel protein [Bacteroidales bacterium]|nr:outer membrane beta-barrel protein [Bacteroidales bacterium]